MESRGCAVGSREIAGLASALLFAPFVEVNGENALSNPVAGFRLVGCDAGKAAGNANG